MHIDVLLGDALPASAEVAGKVVVVIDVLRAATTVATALVNGARAVIPFESLDEPVVFAKQYARDEIRLAGERRMLRIEGFDLGNSPFDYTEQHVKGRTILYTTTNGTRALLATAGARVCFFAAFVNSAVTVSAVRAATRVGDDVLIVCAGHERRTALEDAVCAGRLVRGITRGRTDAVMADGARCATLIERRYQSDMHRLSTEAIHARALADAGFQADVDACFGLGTQPIVIAYQERQLRQYSADAASLRTAATSTT